MDAGGAAEVFAAAAGATSDRVEWRVYVGGGGALHDALAACHAHVAPLVAGYLWQRDPFALGVLAAEGREGGPECLGGAAHVGDAVEDEWFITWLLFDLTRVLPQLTARVWDSDGEFLLIEAAYALPKWARKPEATANRVFVRHGELRLVPPGQRGAAPPAQWTLQDGLRAVDADAGAFGRAFSAVWGADAARLAGDITLAPQPVRDALAAALAGFPERAAAHAHCTRARVPARIAALLRAEPQLVAPAVSAFYERDPAAVRAAGRMAVFPPEELVTVRVRFTRVLYAQLAQQRFEPPRRWPLPPPAHPEHRAAALGAKLSAGFEMMAEEWARAGTPLPPPGAPLAGAAAAPAASPPPMPPVPAAHDPGWHAFRASLQRVGFFGADAAGKDAEKRAAAAYAATAAHARFVAAAAAPAERAAAVLAAAGTDIAAEAFGPPPGPDADDPEEWLLEGEALLERALAARDAERAAHDVKRAAKRAEPGPAQPEPDGDEAEAPSAADAAAAAELNHVARGVRAFVAARGSLHGANVPEAVPPAELQVDPSRFLRELSGALGLDLHELRRGRPGGGGDATSSSASSSSSSATDTDSDSTDLSDDFDVDTEDDDDAGDADACGAAAMEADAAAGADWRRFRPAGADDGDSDDESADSDDEEPRPGDRGGFRAAYAAALDEQLRGTAMASDFARAPAPAPAPAAAAEAGDEDEAMRPVDVDLNLVQSLLASYTAQEGLPGPASSLLGLLGLALPDDADRRDAKGGAGETR